MDVVAWILTVQLWTEPTPQMKFVYTKEYATYEACMEAREHWALRDFPSFCAPKHKSAPPAK